MANKIKKHIVFGDEAHKKLIEGVEIMYRAVCSTLSPKGRNVAVARSWNVPMVIHDGVTVSSAVDHDDPLVKMGMDLVRQAAKKTVEECGDGTTTSILLAREIVQRGIALMNNGKTNPMILRKELKEALDSIVEELSRHSMPVSGNDDIRRVATISSSDEQIGELVAKAMETVGNDGLVTTEDSNTPETFIDHTEGMTFASGYRAPHFVTDPSRMEAVLDNPIIAVIDKKITLNSEIVPLIETMLKIKKDIVIFGEFSGDALSTMVVNKMRGNFNALVVAPPGHADRRESAMQDIALMTGATVFSSELGMEPEDFAEAFDIAWIGKAKRVIADGKSTIIIGGGGDKKKIAAEIKRIRGLKDKAKNEYEREKYEERLAKLTSGVAIIKVGAKTESETREKIERVKDAIGAARAAMKEGIVPGSGKEFIRLRNYLAQFGKDTEGNTLLQDVLESVSRKVMVNSGEDNKRRLFGLLPSRVDVLMNRVIESSEWMGYEAMSGQVKDLMQAGVIDPAKVIRCSLENAISVATSILTTDTLVCTIEEAV